MAKSQRVFKLTDLRAAKEKLIKQVPGASVGIVPGCTALALRVQVPSEIDGIPVQAEFVGQVHMQKAGSLNQKRTVKPKRKVNK